MMKKLTSILLCLTVLFCAAIPAAAAESLPLTATAAADDLLLAATAAAADASGGLSNFVAVKEYTDGQFTDVRSSDWFSGYVASAFRMNLMSGSSATTFNATGYVSMAETITVAAKLHSIYHTGSASGFSSTTPWYKTFVDYARENGIFTTELADYNRPASRAEYVTILSNAFPDEAFSVISDVDDDAIPDVPVSRTYSAAVYKFYRAGILAGSDAKGTFYPDSNIKRSEVATILIKMVDPSQRRETSFKKSAALDAVSVSSLCSPAVFYIEIYDANGNALSSGSGFFIDQAGLAVTNYHVIDGAYSAKVKLADGTICSVTHVCDYDVEKDLALLKIEGGGYQTLTMNTDALVNGQTAFAIGSPYGLDNSISQGIIANAKRTMDGIDYIQFTAPISSGNSGGALLNDKGEVVGITTWTYVDTATTTTQNLNMALPIALVSSLDRSGCYTFPLSGSSASGQTTGQVGEIEVGHSDCLVLAEGDLGALNVFFTSNDFVTVIFDDSACNGLITCEWGEFGDDYIPLYIYGNQSGYCKLVVKLYSADETVLLDTEEIEVYVRPVKITFSQPTVYVKAGGSAVVNVNCNYRDFTGVDYNINFDVDNEFCAGCSWAAEWTDDNNILLTVNGFIPGSTEVDVYIDDDYNLITGNTLQVVVVR